MLTRQKVVIWLLKLADRPVSRTELTKWCFLLRYEGETSGGPAFYDFVPYLYGPFSFALYQEMEKLVAECYLHDDGQHCWFVNDDVARSVALPERSIDRDLRRLLARVKNQSVSDLVDMVYEKYPAFTVNSERRRLASRIEAKPAIYTAGYEGVSIDAFLNRLVVAGIRRVIDVRNNPIARRYGFHKSTFQRLTSRLNIDYVHIPELGIRSEDRQGLTNQQDYDRLFDNYETSVLRAERHAIQAVEKLVVETPSVLVCRESQPQCCHRSRLAKKVARATKLPVEHIRES